MSDKKHQKIVVKEAKPKKPEMRPFLSIDLETTALRPEDGTILEIAAVYIDGKTPFDEAPTFHRVIEFDPNEVLRGNPYALQMNQQILKESIGLEPSIAPKDFIENIAREWSVFLNGLPELKEGKKLVVAGKNAAGFDIPWLKYHKFATSCFDFRVLDPGSLYFDELGKVAGLAKLKEHIGLNSEVTHRALDDALDVAELVLHKMGVKL